MGAVEDITAARHSQSQLTGNNQVLALRVDDDPHDDDHDGHHNPPPDQDIVRV